MTRVLVWDLPTRLFHGLLSSGFIAAAVIALWLGEDSTIFPYHSIKKNAEPSDAIRSSHPVVALVFLTIAGAWAFGLIRNCDSTTRTTRLPVLGVTLQLGEAENEGGHRNELGAATNNEKDEDN